MHAGDAAREFCRIASRQISQGWATSAVKVCLTTDKRRQHLRALMGVNDKQEEATKDITGTGWPGYASISNTAGSAGARQSLGRHTGQRVEARRNQEKTVQQLKEQQPTPRNQST